MSMDGVQTAFVQTLGAIADCTDKSRDNNSPVPKKLVQTLGAIADCTDKSRDNNFPEQTALACSLDTTACCLEGIRGHHSQECFLTRHSSYTLQLWFFSCWNNHNHYAADAYARFVVISMYWGVSVANMHLMISLYTSLKSMRYASELWIGALCCYGWRIWVSQVATSHHPKE